MTTTTRRRGAPAGPKFTGFKVDENSVIMSFEEGEEYTFVVDKMTVEQGDNGEYLAFELHGEGDYESAKMFHNAFLTEKGAPWTNKLLVAMGFTGKDTPATIKKNIVGRTFAARTVLERSNDPQYPDRVRIDGRQVRSAEEAEEGSEAAEVDFNLPDLSDEDVMELAEAAGVEAKTAKLARAKLAKHDQEELAEIWADLDDSEKADPADAAEEVDVAALSDEDALALAEAMGHKVRTAKAAKLKLSKDDPADLAAAYADISEGAEGAEGEITEEAVTNATEEELEAHVETYDLDVDLDTFKTLRKKRAAVLDALKEAGEL